MTDRPEVGKWPWREDGGHAQAEEVEGWDVGYSITNKAPREDGLCGMESSPVPSNTASTVWHHIDMPLSDARSMYTTPSLR